LEDEIFLGPVLVADLLEEFAQGPLVSLRRYVRALARFARFPTNKVSTSRTAREHSTYKVVETGVVLTSDDPAAP
jgi:hypothetical protein